MEELKLLDWIFRTLTGLIVLWGIWATKAIFALKLAQAVANGVESRLSTFIKDVTDKLTKLDAHLDSVSKDVNESKAAIARIEGRYEANSKSNT